ncbi:hypothetical protein BJ994_003033 [Arthrobacter pigmenti]|uniref:Phosphoesterase n=1 Tax=Arthrobacter pigmenti TaxID=271432 RepID=A0A846RUX5_9MICC|nr:calcineurin-like phosphoesterase family protein [Arthrobacter pigmenti]NJC23957.1 hypothetical protein [Arthrobacter pigmenti]
MTPRTIGKRTLAGAAAAVVLIPATFLSLQVATAKEKPEPPIDPTAYVGGPQIIPATGEPDNVLRGAVFDDANKDSIRQPREKGIEGVAVSNGRDVVLTDRLGHYKLTVDDGDTVFITKPARWDTPVDKTNFAQFHYHHSPDGTEQNLRFGGLEPTGPLPKAINFPLAKNKASAGNVTCGILGDVQTYSNQEISFARTGLVRDLSQREDLDACGLLLLGDVAGDDLGMYPRLKENLSAAGAPIRAVPGNHDYDIDATSDEWSFDTFRQHVGPTNFSYDVGQLHIIGLDNVRYPCTPADNEDGKHSFCNDPENKPAYNGKLGEETLGWIEADLKNVPMDKRVVIATHIPLVSHADMTSPKHQTDDVLKLYELLEGREALSLSGHTHSLENLTAGSSFGPWKEAVGVGSIPFDHIVAGAPSGDWYSGDINLDGVPNGIQRDGALPGFLTLETDGASYVDTFHATGRDDDQMALAVNSPHFRDWFQTLMDWRADTPYSDTDAVPPVALGDLGDPGMVTPPDLADGTWLTANIWNGTKESSVSVSIDGGAPVSATHTQPATGEGQLSGAEYADPYAAIRQLQVARFAFESTSGNPEAQGFSLYAGSQYGPSAPRPGNNIAQTMSHMWRFELPGDLEVGVHTADITTTDRHGRTFTETLVFEVVEERPQQNFRSEVFD